MSDVNDHGNNANPHFVFDDVFDVSNFMYQEILHLLTSEFPAVRDFFEGFMGLATSFLHFVNPVDLGRAFTPSQVDILPRHHVEQAEVDDEAQCSICFELFTLAEETVQLPCRHIYHRDCIGTWLAMRGDCPLCRQVARRHGSPARIGRSGAAAIEANAIINVGVQNQDINIDAAVLVPYIGGQLYDIPQGFQENPDANGNGNEVRSEENDNFF